MQTDSSMDESLQNGASTFTLDALGRTLSNLVCKVFFKAINLFLGHSILTK